MVTHLDGQHDRYLHNKDGSHRSTAPTADGSVLASYERRIKEHLAEHRRQGHRLPEQDSGKESGRDES